MRIQYAMWSTIAMGRVGVIKSLGLMVFMLLGMAYLTLAERKGMATIQRRRGPNLVGLYGLLTPRADGLKLLRKELVIPASSNPILFQRAPVITFSLALVGWTVMPFGYGRVLADVPRGVRMRFAVGSLGVYGIILAGWASNSKYAFLGAMRSTAQMVSYEVSMGFVRVTVFLCAGTMNLTERVRAQQPVWYVFPLFPMFLRFFVSALAEKNRHHYDLHEDESVLVSGFNVEYSGMAFALFFLGEYMNMILMSGTMSVLFLGGWLPPRELPPRTWVPGAVWFSLKVTFYLRGFIWARAAYPRFRYDQLMRLGWKVLLPVSLGWVCRVSGRLVGLDGLPQ